MQTITRRMSCGLFSTLAGLLVTTQLAAVEPGFSEGESITLEPSSGDYIVTYTGNENQALTTVYEPATKINPQVYSKINLGSDGLITYSYALESEADSRQRIVDLLLEPISNIKARRSVRPTLNDSALDDAEILDRYRACIEAIQTPAGWSSECLDRRDKSSTWLSLGWVYDYRAGAQRGLSPGGVVQGMEFMSFDLPGISVGRMEGKAEGWKNEHDPRPGDMDEYSLSAAFTKGLRDIKKKDFVARYVAAPTFNVLNPFNGVALLEQIRDHVKGWPQQQLMEQAFWQQIDNLLAAAITALKNNNKAGAASNLIQIRIELRKKYPDLDVTTAMDDPKASALPATPDALKPYLSAHDRRLAAKVLDFDAGYTIAKLGAGAMPFPTDGTIYAPPTDADGSFKISWGRPVSKVQTVCGPSAIACEEEIIGYVLETANNMNFTGARTIYDGPDKEFNTVRYAPGTSYFRVKAHMRRCTTEGWFSGEGGSCLLHESGKTPADTSYYAVGPNVTVVTGQ